MDQSVRLVRGNTTWLLYGTLSCLGFLLNGLGAVLEPLQDDLGVGRAQVAFYPAFFAVGLLVIGFTGGPLVNRIGRAMALRLSIAGMILGGLLLATPNRVLTLCGALLLGIGAAILIQLIPALLAALYPHSPSAAVGEANGLASAASILAPLSVAGALALGLGWRIGYLVPPLAALVLIAAVVRRIPLPEAPAPAERTVRDGGQPILGRWLAVVLAVSVEFCMVFWAASAFTDWHDASSSVAPAAVALFLVGMATGRSLAVPITRRVPDVRVLMLVCTAVAAAGFGVFWAAPTLPLAAAGLLVTGLGLALLYPMSVSRTVAAWPHAPDRAAARAALASGLAIGGAPYLLAQLNELTELRTAYLVVPALLLALTLLTLRIARP